MISGYVETVAGRHITGWAAHDDPKIVLEIVVERDGVVIGSGHALAWRDDIGRGAGFAIDLDQEVGAADVLKAAVWLRAQGGAESQRLPLLPHIAEEARTKEAENVAEAFSRLDAAQQSIVMERIGRPDTEVFDRVRSRSRFLTVQGPQPYTYYFKDFPDTVSIEVPVGLISPDGMSILGREGHCFVGQPIEPGPETMQLGALSPSLATELAARWQDLVVARQAHVCKAGALFLQIIIPEKQSLLPDYFPVTIATPTPLFAAVERDLRLQLFYLSVLDHMRSGSLAPTAVFRRYESHLSTRGALALAFAMLERLGCRVDIGPVEYDPEFSHTDLLVKFFGVHISERIDNPRGPILDALGETLVLMDRKDADAGHTVVGLRRVWKNPGAPIPMKILVFGNSFFDRGEQPNNLTWWFARLFDEVHFHWSAAFDPLVFARVAPDAVICQTIERFMPEVPEA